MQRYAITDRRLLAGFETDRRQALVAQAARLAAEGVQYLQIREKDLTAAELLPLTRAMRDAAAAAGGRMRLLLNGPVELAQEAGVGLHVPFSDWRGAARAVSISCHTYSEIAAARGFAELLLFAPVFEKRVAGEEVRPGRGLDALAQACAAAHGVPVFALGGITVDNAASCIAAGASGVAAIRMFL